MGEMVITNKVADLQKIFSKISNVYYIDKKDTPIANLTTAKIELPVISDGVTFDMGAPDVTRIRLTTEQMWTSISTVGDPDISFQVSSLSEEILSLFLEKASASNTSVVMGSTIGGNTFSGKGYNMTSKKATGGLLMLSEDKDIAIFLPSVEMFGTPVIEQGSKPAYFNVQVTPVPSPEGQIIFLEKTAVTP